MLYLLGAISTAGIIFLVLFLVLLVAVIAIICIFVPLKLWLKTITSGVYISMIRLANLKQRKYDVNEITDAYISIKKSGLNITLNELETHILSGGSIKNVINALVTANNANIDLSIDLAKAIDLAGLDAVETVKSCITPKVISTDEITAVTKDSIEIKVKANITIKPQLYKLIGGTGEDTIKAKIAEAITSCIGAVNNHKEVLENPEIISQKALAKYEDNDSAYIIISLDLVDVKMGKNIGAKLRLDEIEVEERIANARAEQLKAEAYLREKDLSLKAQQITVEKLKAEAEVPKKIIKVFEQGDMSLMDYYKLQNIIADTNMRKAIAKTGSNDIDSLDA